MYLVEFTKKEKKGEKKYCSGFYSRDEAMHFSGDLIHASNIKSVIVSEVDNFYINKICEPICGLCI